MEGSNAASSVLALLAFGVNSSLERPQPMTRAAAEVFFLLQSETALGAP